MVDDGSTDATGVLADRIAGRDPRVRVVHTENHGLGAARNEGVRHATGDLLAFADSDDIVPPGAYAAMVRRLDADLGRPGDRQRRHARRTGGSSTAALGAPAAPRRPRRS